MLNLIKYKVCKRCGGDLFLERDSEGFYVSCLQCGAVFLRRINREVPLPEPKRSKIYAH